jgi:ethanolamine ammonia-lyase large subunit
LRRPSQAGYLDRTFSARSASVSHRSAISMKKDLCSEVRAASANRMHSATLLRNCAKLSKRASIPYIWGLPGLFARRMYPDPRLKAARMAIALPKADYQRE